MDATAWTDWAAVVLAAHRSDEPEQHREAIDRRWAALIAEDSPLMRMAGAWRLTATEIGTLAICGAVEWDTNLRTLTAAAGLTPELLRQLLGDDALAALAHSVLTDGCLVQVDERGPLGAAEVRLPRAVTWMLADVPTPDAELPAATELVDVGSEDTASWRSTRITIASPDPVRQEEAVARHLDAPAFISCTPPTTAAGWQAVIRQATAGVLGVSIRYDVMQAPDALARYWITRAAHLPWAICAPQPLPSATLTGEHWRDAPADQPEVTDREWSAVFPGAALPRRRPSAQMLRRTAYDRADGEEPADALRRVAGRALVRHATRHRPTDGWDALVLPPAQQRQLHELVDRYRQRATVHDRWRLPLFPSPGVVALFAGPSGTGKTTAAGVIAAELGVDMFRVDLSALVSKYIGETEKNLEEVFTAAQDGDFLLLFDEADALFGKRSDVSDARDRYANVETAYLLQRLEAFDGFVVMTSNFQGNIDEAFLRRIHVSISFAVPEAADRERIWDRCLAEAPRGDLDLSFVSQQFDLTGGSIRLAALTAATTAAARDGAIEMADILHAVDREMTKLRRRTNEAQFGPWRAVLAT